MDETRQWRIFYETRMAAAVGAFALLVALERVKKRGPLPSERPPPDDLSRR